MDKILIMCKMIMQPSLISVVAVADASVSLCCCMSGMTSWRNSSTEVTRYLIAFLDNKVSLYMHR